MKKGKEKRKGQKKQEMVSRVTATIFFPRVMSEQNFRAALNQFRWSSTNDPSSSSQPLSANATAEPGFFSRMYQSTSAYVPLRSNERSNEEEAYFALSRWERSVLSCPGRTCLILVLLVCWDSVLVYSDLPSALWSPS